MPPRLLRPVRTISSLICTKRALRSQPGQINHYATAAAAVQLQTPDHTISPPAKVSRHPKTQPPSYKSPAFRKSQLLRQYAAIIQGSPLFLVFQHNNLNAYEWTSIRRELTLALQKVDQDLIASGANAPPPPPSPASSKNKKQKGPKTYVPIPFEPAAPAIKLQTVQTAIFGVALKTVELFKAEEQAQAKKEGDYTHILSVRAHSSIVDKKASHGLEPLLSGPIAVLTFPTISPAHLKAALSILSPSPPAFPAPTRRANPGYHEPAVQSGLQKLMLLAARVEGKVFDSEGTRWVGSIEGGLEGLRGQLVNLLRSVGAGITGTLESASKNLYFTLEGRRMSLEDESGGKAESEGTKEEIKAE